MNLNDIFGFFKRESTGRGKSLSFLFEFRGKDK